VSKKDAGLVSSNAPSAGSAHSDFLRRFLHDLATPLSAIALHLEAAERRLRRGGDPSESLAIARKEVSRACDLFDRGRELLLLEASAEESISLDGLVSDVLAGCDAPAARIVGSTGGFVKADRRALAETLRALVSNALGASPASSVSVLLERNRERLEVRVRNPARLPAADPESLFSPRAAGEGKSWGFGLARARLLCAAAGGTVKLEQIGDDVVATVELPEEDR
jgi:signal transduction histidine kinase